MTAPENSRDIVSSLVNNNGSLSLIKMNMIHISPIKKAPSNAENFAYLIAYLTLPSPRLFPTNTTTPRCKPKEIIKTKL